MKALRPVETWKKMPPAAKKECPVCVEEFTKAQRKEVACLHCGYGACAGCVKRYILSSYEDPGCMQCHRPWDREFLVDNLTSTFVSATQKKHREDQLLDRERALLPLTQPYVEREVARRKAQEIQRQINAKESEKNRLFWDSEAIKEKQRQIAVLEAQLKTLRIEINTYSDPGISAIVREIRALQAKKDELDRAARGHGGAGPSQEKARFVMRCPNDGCKGFLSTAWKCGVCEHWACPECHETKGTDRKAEHTCKPENVETAKLLAKDTKGCPKCGVPIHRIHGCNQMFCTCCHTGFDWQTLAIINTARGFHNPHYYEMREQLGNVVLPQAPADDNDPCAANNNVPRNEVITHVVESNGLNPARIGPKGFRILMFIRWLNEIANQDIPRLERRLDVDAQSYGNNQAVALNAEIRISYMLNEVDEDGFKSAIQKREKQRHKLAEIIQVHRSFVALSWDVIRQIVAAQTQGAILGCVEGLERLMALSRDGLDRISKKYACKTGSYLVIPGDIYVNPPAVAAP